MSKTEKGVCTACDEVADCSWVRVQYTQRSSIHAYDGSSYTVETAKFWCSGCMEANRDSLIKE